MDGPPPQQRRSFVEEVLRGMGEDHPIASCVLALHRRPCVLIVDNRFSNGDSPCPTEDQEVDQRVAIKVVAGCELALTTIPQAADLYALVVVVLHRQNHRIERSRSC